MRLDRITLTSQDESGNTAAVLGHVERNRKRRGHRWVATCSHPANPGTVPCQWRADNDWLNEATDALTIHLATTHDVDHHPS